MTVVDTVYNKWKARFEQIQTSKISIEEPKEGMTLQKWINFRNKMNGTNQVLAEEVCCERHYNS